MGIRLPAPLGAFSIGATDDAVDSTERKVRPYYGTGHYGGDDTAHQNYRRGQAVGLAYYRAWFWLLLFNSSPSDAVALMDEWEATLGLPHAPDSWSYEDRLNRIRARVIEPRGAHIDNIEDALVQLITPWFPGGASKFILSQPYGAVPMSYLVVMDEPLNSCHPLIPDIVALLWRMTPAHVSCWIQPDGAAAVELGTVL